MRRPGGLILETDLSTGNVKEYDTYCCKHCNRHVILWKNQRSAGHFCSHCSGVICPQCAAKGDCDPLEKKLERWASRDRLYQNIREM
jgi:hypothetical protein